MNENKDALIILKWSGKEYLMSDLTEHDTVAVLKHEIYKKTQVEPKRQKLLNLKYKGKMAADEVQLSNLELKPNFKLMMVGSTEADIEDVCNPPEGTDTVIDDFDDNEEKDESLENKTVYLSKIEKRIRDYEIHELNTPREGKRLLVLDIDYTIFDHRSVAETGVELTRPHLHEFLTSAYKDYDIVIWSATGMKWIEEKMKLMGISTNTNYRIMFNLDSHAMISVYTAEKGVFDVKPLGVIWGKYPQYGPHNTIMFDDIRRNFLMNPKSGLRIRPYRQAHLNKDTDIQLILLGKYLKEIANNCDDFKQLNHRKWEQYISRDQE